jgi:hypothetical protein
MIVELVVDIVSEEGSHFEVSSMQERASSVTKSYGATRRTDFVVHQPYRNGQCRLADPTHC